MFYAKSNHTPIAIYSLALYQPLDRAFSKELGTSIAQMTIQQRIAKAKIMFRETNCSIAEVAASLGFCHGAHLSNVFRRLVGTTPGKYRRTT